MLSITWLVGRLKNLNSSSGGVYATADLAVLVGRDHPVHLAKTIRRLLREGVLLRVRRGLYVDKTNGYRPELVGQQWLAPSYLSTESALDRHGLCQTGILAFTYVTTRLIPARKVAVRRLEEHEFIYRHLARHLFYGYESREGVLMAEPEKAAIDFLYFRYKGQRSVISPEDVDFRRLRLVRFRRFLRSYQQRGFRNFALHFLSKRGS